MGVILRAHPVRGESHIQRNANGDFATVPIRSFFLHCACLRIKQNYWRYS